MLAYLIPLAVVLCGAASAARAACALQLDGDPELIAPVRAAIDTFRDDGATCVDVRALCSRDASDIVIDLRDQLGRSVQRRFATPEGAAAFLVSWSRRPLPQTGTGLDPSGRPPGGPSPGAASPGITPPGATPPGATPPSATPPDAARLRPRLTIGAGIPGLGLAAGIPGAASAEAPEISAEDDLAVHPEVRVAYISAPLGASTVDGLAGALDTGFLLHHGSMRYGAGVRAIAASASQQHVTEGVTSLRWVEFDAEALLGSRWRFNRIVLGGELFAGYGFVSVTSVTSQNDFLAQARAHGLRGGARASVASQLFSALWFEARMGWDGLRQIGATAGDEVLHSDHYLGRLHLEIGLLWAP